MPRAKKQPPDVQVAPSAPYSFMQWKGTDVCMDFHCLCGAHHHVDGMFVYAIRCMPCGRLYEMPWYIQPILIDETVPKLNPDGSYWHANAVEMNDAES